MTASDDKKLTIATKSFYIEINLDTLYGYFEHNTRGEEWGGGLWLENNENGLELTDYDGVFALPLEVYDALKPHVYMDESCNPRS